MGFEKNVETGPPPPPKNELSFFSDYKPQWNTRPPISSSIFPQNDSVRKKGAPHAHRNTLSQYSYAKATLKLLNAPLVH